MPQRLHVTVTTGDDVRHSDEYVNMTFTVVMTLSVLLTRRIVTEAIKPSDDVLLERGFHCTDGITVDIWPCSLFSRSPDKSLPASLTLRFQLNIAVNSKTTNGFVIRNTLY